MNPGVLKVIFFVILKLDLDRMHFIMCKTKLDESERLRVS